MIGRRDGPRRGWFFRAVLAFCLLSASPAQAADLAAGRQLAEKVCAACHGLDGQAAAAGDFITPKIGGQKKLYLVDRLKDYRAGRLEHVLMTPIASGLGDADIHNAAEWYSRIKIESPWFTQEAAMGMVDDSRHPDMTDARRAGKLKAEQVCSNCHGLYGQSVTAGNSAVVPNLSAQRKAFIVSRLEDFRAGRRQSGQMSFIVKMLSDVDIDRVAEWYSGVETTVIDPDQAMAASNE